MNENENQLRQAKKTNAISNGDRVQLNDPIAIRVITSFNKKCRKTQRAIRQKYNCNQQKKLKVIINGNKMICTKLQSKVKMENERI